MTPEEVLLAAADIVEAGWTKGMYARATEDGETYCSVGAIYKVAGYDYAKNFSERGIEEWDSRLAYDAMVKLENVIDCGDIPHWNDNVMQSGEDVAAWMRKAAEA